MLDIILRPHWEIRRGADSAGDDRLLPFLAAIATHGTLAAAARQMGLSYRHAWDLLARWTAFFGQDLVVLQKGRGAQLSALGEALLLADRRVQERLARSLQDLAGEIADDLNRLLAQSVPVVRLVASHSYAIAALRQRLTQQADLRLEVQIRGSQDALAALVRGQCDVAGFHLPAGALGAAAARTLARLIKPRRGIRVMQVAERQQGLMVRPGNPLALQGVADLARPGVRFVNREPGSGTRALLEALLAEAGVAPENIAGFEHEELTHSAVSAFVAGNLADAGMGVEAAARQGGLDFLPLVREQYFLAVRQDKLATPGLDAFLRPVRDPDFHAAVDAIPGYSAARCGEWVELEEIFPAP